MDITPPVPTGRQLIQAYGDGGFRIADQHHTGAVLVFPERTAAWPVQSIEALTTASLATLQDAVPAIEILLIGCGVGMAFIKPDIRDEVRKWGIVIDAMNTGAACRTYNVLLSEDRRVAAALLPVI